MDRDGYRNCSAWGVLTLHMVGDIVTTGIDVGESQTVVVVSIKLAGLFVDVFNWRKTGGWDCTTDPSTDDILDQ